MWKHDFIQQDIWAAKLLLIAAVEIDPDIESNDAYRAVVESIKVAEVVMEEEKQKLLN